MLVRHFCTAQHTTHRLTELPALTMEPTASAPASVRIDPSVRYQEIEGFGGAFTDAAAATYARLSPARQAEFLAACFNPTVGLGYTLCRATIGSSDFSKDSYTYADVPGDVELACFSIDHDRRARLPMIKAAQATTAEPIRILAAPWSPPAWMKTNGDRCHGGSLRPEYRRAWAAYLCRFIQEYGSEGIPIWGLSLQNEPMANQIWESCLYTAEEERDFVRDYLGPALARNDLRHVRLLIWDHNRDWMFERAAVILSDREAAQYVWGTAFHWYVGDHFDNVQWTHDAFPNKKLLFTEGCQEGGPHLGEWLVGERYARSMINDLNRWTVGWIDWNLILDETGGPNHAGNYCSAPIIADTSSDELLFQSSYFYIGHFARFIRPGAERILCAATHDALEATAFANPDGKIAVVVLNRSEEALPFALKLGTVAAATVSLPHSIATYLLTQE